MSEVSAVSEKKNLAVWCGLSTVWTGFLPLLYWHLTGLLSRPHYQFILLMPVALWLLWNSLEKPVSDHPPAKGRWFGILILIMTAFGLGYASLIWSPWIAAVCCLLASLGVMIAMLGMTRASRFLPIWLFCWILIPPPFGLDETIIVRLRTVTTNMTSAVLDQFGVLHQVYANVIELPGKPLFIADACSGIHSLYVLIGLALFLAVYARRTFLHGIFLIATTFLIVLLENVSRIASVAFAWQKGIDLSMGWKHEALGVALFILSSLLILSADQLLLFVLPVDPIGWIRSLRISGGKKRRAVKPIASERSFWSKAAFGFCCVFPVFLVPQLARMPALPSLPATFQSEVKLPELGRDLLPEELSGFRLVSFESIERVAGDPFGRSSQRWTYEKSGLSVGVSLDYPYDGVKDMTECYKNVGWTIQPVEMLTTNNLGSQSQTTSTEGPVAIAALDRDLLGCATLLFSSFDLQGNIEALVKAPERSSAESKISNRLEALNAKDAAVLTQGNPPYFQVHVLTRSADHLRIDERSEVLDLYLEARRRIMAEVITLKTRMSGEAR